MKKNYIYYLSVCLSAYLFIYFSNLNNTIFSVKTELITKRMIGLHYSSFLFFAKYDITIVTNVLANKAKVENDYTYTEWKMSVTLGCLLHPKLQTVQTLHNPI